MKIVSLLKLLFSIASLTALFACAGCAHISFHESGDRQRKNIGVEYYQPKLYLLLTRTGTGAYKAEILTLPDLARPRYALLHPGYGSSNLSLKLSNGILTDIGQQADSKIPETITALGSLATSAAGIAKAFGLDQEKAPEDDKPAFELFEIATRDGEIILKRVAVRQLRISTRQGLRSSPTKAPHTPPI